MTYRRRDACAPCRPPSAHPVAVQVPPPCPAENGLGVRPPFLRARVVLEHTVWGSLVGSACKAHHGRAT